MKRVDLLMKKEEAVKELLKQTKEKEETLYELLNQPLSFIQKALVDGLYTFYFDVLGKKPKIDEDAARQASASGGIFLSAEIRVTIT